MNLPMLFPEYAPDVTPLGANGTGQLISGVFPRADGYGPVKALQSFTTALPAACRGFFFARNTDGSITIFAGTATRLYRLDNTTFGWTDVSKGGSAYSSLVDEDNWQFVQYNATIIAVQKNVPPQSYVLGSSSAFADLGGSPPQASHIAVVNFFVVLTGLLSNPNRVQWSDLDNITEWTAGVGLADFEDLPDGGNCHGISGGDAYGIIFQDQAVRTLTYAPGSSVVFQIIRISQSDALYAQYAVVQAGERTFFLSAQGFKMIMPGGVPQPIGKERLDRTFFADVDTSSLQLVQAATDPSATRVYFSYKSIAGQAALWDKILCYDWSIGQNGRWTIIPMVGEFLAALSKPGLTLEQMDSLAPGALSVVGTADNGAGLIRLELNELSNSYFDIHGQNFIVVQNVGGTTEANGTWKFNIIDATHIDLTEDAATGTPSAYANAWTSGGAIGGSLDALPFSLDSISVASIARLAAVGSDHSMGFFDGANIEAILETSEIDGEGQLLFVDTVRPITDSPDALISLGSRYFPSDSVSYTTESGIGDDGTCGQLLEARYIRGRMRIPAGSTWTYAKSVQAVGQPAGER